MAKNRKIKMTDDEAGVLVRVLDMIERKFKFNPEDDRFVCSPEGSVMSLEFEVYAHLNSLRARLHGHEVKGGRR